MFPQIRLTPAEINKAKPRAKAYKLAAGGGLFLLVNPNGGKYWRLKYRFEGKENTLSIGGFPEVSYSAALKASKQAKTLLKHGIDPNQAKREAAKIKPRSAAYNAVFRMAMSDTGGIVIEMDSKILKLTPTQTVALKAFLIAAMTGGTGSKHVDE